MTAAGLIARLREHGHSVRLDGSEVVIRPRPDAEMLVELRACRDEIVDYLRRTPPASDHRYVLWNGAVDPSRSVCIACGKPPALHSDGALDGALVIACPDEIILIDAYAIAATAAARETAS